MTTLRHTAVLAILVARLGLDRDFIHMCALCHGFIHGHSGHAAERHGDRCKTFQGQAYSKNQHNDELNPVFHCLSGYLC